MSGDYFKRMQGFPLQTMNFFAEVTTVWYFRVKNFDFFRGAPDQ